MHDVDEDMRAIPYQGGWQSSVNQAGVAMRNVTRASSYADSGDIVVASECRHLRILKLYR